MPRPDAYASAPDVIARLSHVATFTATTRPNATQVHEGLIAASNDLDSAIFTADYTVPVATGATVSREFLRTWAAVGAACKVSYAMPQGDDSKHLRYCEEFAEILLGLKTGDLGLPDAGKDETMGRGAHAAVATGATPYFTRAGIMDR